MAHMIGISILASRFLARGILLLQQEYVKTLFAALLFFFSSVAVVPSIASAQSCSTCDIERADCVAQGGIWKPLICECLPVGYEDPSPIIISLSRNGLSLTSAADGVDFDLNADGVAERIAWTAVDTDDAFLVLDRNGNGTVDSGVELFGNFTPQPQSDSPNGFLALAVFDEPENGGNGDGIIDSDDLIFRSLRLWVDANHNGVSGPDELFALPARGVASISLRYRESRRTDEYGNQFRYRARVNMRMHTDTSRWAWDVFLVADN